MATERRNPILNPVDSECRNCHPAMMENAAGIRSQHFGRGGMQTLNKPKNHGNWEPSFEPLQRALSVNRLYSRKEPGAVSGADFAGKPSGMKGRPHSASTRRTHDIIYADTVAGLFDTEDSVPMTISKEVLGGAGVPGPAQKDMKLFKQKRMIKEEIFEGCAGRGTHNVRAEVPKPRLNAVSLAGVVIFNQEVPKANLIDVYREPNDGVVAAGKWTGARMRRHVCNEAEPTLQPKEPETAQSQQTDAPGAECARNCSEVPGAEADGISPKGSKASRSGSGASSTTTASSARLSSKAASLKKGKGSHASSVASGQQSEKPMWR
jgi:hypothetical protein